MTAFLFGGLKSNHIGRLALLGSRALALNLTVVLEAHIIPILL